jgi:hypothetical protein
MNRCKLFLAIGLLTLVSSASLAEEFRIETKIYVGKEEEPVSSTQTLFHRGVVYDFLAKPEQIAIFRKVKTELTTDQLADVINKLRNWASRQRDPFLKFAANPQFNESFDRDTGQLLLASHQESYTIKTEPADSPTALAEYREFLDWYARLNTLLLAGPPPEPRLAVNAALARYQVVPVSVELVRNNEKEKLRAEHEFAWLLSKKDLARIDEAQKGMAAYRPVDNEEFLDGLRYQLAEEAKQAEE